MSFENKKPVIYVHSLATGKRTVAPISGFEFGTGVVARRPQTGRGADQGWRLAALYPQRRWFRRRPPDLIRRIDTEPQFSPDGQFIYFTSTAAAARRSIASRPTAATHSASPSRAYNVTPRLSPDGKAMAFITRGNGGFRSQ